MFFYCTSVVICTVGELKWMGPVVNVKCDLQPGRGAARCVECSVVGSTCCVISP
jgi:ribosomal protein S28E/S33